MFDLLLLFEDVDFIQTQTLPLRDLWLFLPVGYMLTIVVETPILVAGLPTTLSLRQKLLCGVWLSACTYPIVVLVLPTIFFGRSRVVYLFVAETFAPVAECFLFWLAFRNKNLLNAGQWAHSFIAIVFANLASFGVGEIFNY